MDLDSSVQAVLDKSAAFHEFATSNGFQRACVS